MNKKAILMSISKVVANGVDNILLRIVSDSKGYQLNLSDTDDINNLGDLLTKNAASAAKVDREEILDWIEKFGTCDERISIKKFIDQEGHSVKIILERITDKPNIFIFGAGHVGQALALISVLVGYEVVVVDDRPEFVSRDRLPDLRIKLIVDDFDSAIRSLNIGSRSAAVIVTRGHQFDEICLENLLRLRVNYLGMIGSKRRVLSIFKRLRQQGFANVALSKVHAPIGLSIGAKSPQEIAIAILAEIIAEANKTSLMEKR
ncbi:MAG: XdhC family protein [Blastocatellia bacterium]